MNHTPGPWLLDAGRLFHTTSGDFYLSYSSDPITKMPHFPKFEELDCNAHLISVAPDMYEALKDLIAWADAFPLEAGEDDLPVVKRAKTILELADKGNWIKS